MATHVFIPMLGKRIRVTELDLCGVVTPASTHIVTDGFITVTLSSEVEDGAEIIVKKANGQLCVNERLSDSFKRFTVEIEFCGVNPSLLSLVSNAEPYRDYAGDVAGFTVGEGEINKRFAFELWTGLSGVACLPGQVDEASGYMLVPYIAAGVPGDITIDGENTVTFSITGAYTKGGNQWGFGPYAVLRNSATTNEVQQIAITGAPTGGTFKLAFAGQQTVNIDYDATALDIRTALAALNDIEESDITVTGGPLPGSPIVVTFGGRFDGNDVEQLTAVSSLTGGSSPAVVVTTTTQGHPGYPRRLPTALDPYDHLLIVDTALAPPPLAQTPALVWPQPATAKVGDVFTGAVFDSITAEDATNAGRLAGLGFLASPLTPWTTSQSITVNGFEFNWTGSAWAAGAHS